MVYIRHVKETEKQSLYSQSIFSSECTPDLSKFPNDRLSCVYGGTVHNNKDVFLCKDVLGMLREEDDKLKARQDHIVRTVLNRKCSWKENNFKNVIGED